MAPTDEKLQIELWTEAAEQLIWDRAPDDIFRSGEMTDYSWFPGGRLNTCFNAVDRHVQDGFGQQLALIYDSPLADKVARYTYDDLLEHVSLAAGMLCELGVEKGDRVIIYMPMIPETVFAILACARIGAIHSVVFGGFASKELAVRIEDADAKILLTATCGIEPVRVVPYMPLVSEALEMADHRVEHVVVKARQQCPVGLIPGRDIDWDAAIASADAVPCTATDAADPLYILYTSGTTGRPKGIVRECGGHAVALKWSMSAIYNCRPGDVFWAASDVGWVVGHSYIVYAPLLQRCTTILYEGKPVGTPDPGAFWRVIDEHSVNVLFTAPTAIRAIRQVDPNAEYLKRNSLNSLRSLFLAGERCDPSTLKWSEKNLNVPVIDHWWQTETGWPIAANCLGLQPLPIKPGSPTKAVPGWQIKILREDGSRALSNESGEIVCQLPLPPGALRTLWNDHDRFIADYLTTFPGYYRSGDVGLCDEDGYFFVLSRTDDVINTAGHRLSTGVMEEILSSIDEVAECAVVGIADDIKGQIPMGLLVLKAGALNNKTAEEILSEAVACVRTELGPVAAFKKVLLVKRLPKTRSGKILRKIIRQIADGQSYDAPATIEDVTVLDEIAGALQEQM